MLAVLPVLGPMSHWNFYSQTAICIPLPVTSAQHFKGHTYSFAIIVVLNFVLFLLIRLVIFILMKFLFQFVLTVFFFSEKN